MKRLLSIVGNYGGVSKRTFVFVKDMYGHNRVNISTRHKFHIGANELRMLCEDSRFDQNAFITDNRIIFNGLTIEDLSPEERAMYDEDINN